MKKGDKIELNIYHQGYPKLNEAVITSISDDLVALSIDMHTKHDKIFAYSNCGLILSNDKDNETETTHFEFSQFKETHYVFAASASKYTINVCLIKLDL